MYKEESSFGIVLISGEKSICYKIAKCGDHIDIKKIRDTSVRLQSRQKKGGQSAPRIERLRQEKEEGYIKKVSNMIVSSYMIDNNTKCAVKGLVFAGPSLLKNKVRGSNLIVQYFDKLILKVINTSEIKNTTVLDVYNRCEKEFCTSEEKESVSLRKKIQDMIEQADERLVFGYKEVVSNLQDCMLETLLMYSEIDCNQKETIYKLNTYECKIIEVNRAKFGCLEIDIIGIKWY